jgi:hypothetical protein
MAGTVDANGVLWKSTMVGSFTESFGGCTNLYDTLAASAKKQGDKPAAGLRPIVSSEMVDGFEKLMMATYFEWLTYTDYLKESRRLPNPTPTANPNPNPNPTTP